MTSYSGLLTCSAFLLLLGSDAALSQTALSETVADGRVSTQVLQLFVLIAAIGILPGLLVSATCFPTIVVTLSILRQGLGLQQAPPNMLLIGFSLILTAYVMEPVASQSWQAYQELGETDGIFSVNQISTVALPFIEFMTSRADRDVLLAFQGLRNASDLGQSTGVNSLFEIFPAFVVSELSLAFYIGFLLLLPFLIIDLVVAAILMSMGMMMVPPAIVSLPFKIGFFVLADGWLLLSSSLIGQYS